MLKRILIFLFCPLLLQAAQNNFPLIIDTNGIIRGPTNFKWGDNYLPYVVIEGDSLSTGEYAEDTESYGLKLLRTTNWFYYYSYTNFAASGNQVSANMSGQYASETHTVRPSVTNSGNCIFFFWGGINDIRQDVSTNTICQFLSNICFSARQDGFKVVGFTIPIWGAADSNTTRQVARTNVNLFIKNNLNSLYDYIVDVDAMFPWSTSTRVGDLLHLNSAANQLIASNINRFIPPRMTTPIPVIGGYHKGLLSLYPDGPDAYPYTNIIIQTYFADGTKALGIGRNTIGYTFGIISIQAPGIGIGWNHSFMPGDMLSLNGGDAVIYNGGKFKFSVGASNYTAIHSIPPQIYDYLGNTNFSTATNALLGGFNNGYTNIPALFWAVGRTIEITTKGVVYSPATPGNTIFMVNCWQGAFPNTIGTNLFPIAASLVNEPYEISVIITCRTNSSIGYLQCNGSIKIPSAAGSTTLASKDFFSTGAIFNTTAAMALSIDSTNGASTIGFVGRSTKGFLIP